MEWLTDPQSWIALITLIALELVLGIDNIIFISILAGKLPPGQRKRAQRTGLGLAMFIRIGLLLSISWIIHLTDPFFSVIGQDISGRDLILILGGLFLLAKSTNEIHDKLEGGESTLSVKGKVSFAGTIVQILLLDIVFSLDSVITAVGMVDNVQIMITAIVVSVACMMFIAAPISAFVDQHPTIKILALSFLLLIGVTLIAEGFDQHIPKGYIYFSMAFSVFVEMLNLRMRRKKTAPVMLHQPFIEKKSG